MTYRGFICAFLAAVCFAVLLIGLVSVYSDRRVHAQTKIAPAQLQSQPHFVALACLPPGTASVSNCQGLFYIDLVTAAGTELKLIGAPIAAPFDPTMWQPVP